MFCLFCLIIVEEDKGAYCQASSLSLPLPLPPSIIISGLKRSVTLKALGDKFLCGLKRSVTLKALGDKFLCTLKTEEFLAEEACSCFTLFPVHVYFKIFIYLLSNCLFFVLHALNFGTSKTSLSSSELVWSSLCSEKPDIFSQLDDTCSKLFTSCSFFFNSRNQIYSINPLLHITDIKYP